MLGELVHERAGIDPPTIEQTIDGMQHCAEYAKLEDIRCTAGARDMEAAKTCIGDFINVLLRAAMASSKRPEVVKDLERMGVLARAAHEKTGRFPVGTTGLTPRRSCCDMPARVCAAADEDWNGPWRALGFVPEHETLLYQYAYDSDGTSATITGTADLDCDGTAVTYTLEARVVSGAVETSLRSPTTAD